jgi:hypothetical protein
LQAAKNRWRRYALHRCYSAFVRPFFSSSKALDGRVEASGGKIGL